MSLRPPVVFRTLLNHPSSLHLVLHFTSVSTTPTSSVFDIKFLVSQFLTMNSRPKTVIIGTLELFQSIRNPHSRKCRLSGRSLPLTWNLVKHLMLTIRVYSMIWHHTYHNFDGFHRLWTVERPTYELWIQWRIVSHPWINTNSLITTFSNLASSNLTIARTDWTFYLNGYWG